MRSVSNTIAKTILLPGILALVLSAGCNQDQGVTVDPKDAAKLQQQQQAAVEKQIAEVENNPRIPAERKQMIIGNIRAGAARMTSGTQAGQSQGGAKK